MSDIAKKSGQPSIFHDDEDDVTLTGSHMLQIVLDQVSYSVADSVVHKFDYTRGSSPGRNYSRYIGYENLQFGILTVCLLFYYYIAKRISFAPSDSGV